MVIMMYNLQIRSIYGTAPPFEPVIKKTAIHPEGAIFARGACDDKGQMYMHVKAVEYMIATETCPAM